MNNGLNPVSDEDEKKIVRDCVIAAGNIKSMTRRAYQFLYLSQGFIAHYDQAGFMEYYKEPGSLKKEILDLQNENQWNNFSHRDKDYNYYMQKKKIYNAVCDCLNNGVEFKTQKKQPKTIEFEFGW